MPLIQNKWGKFALASIILVVVIWKGAIMAPWYWKVVFCLIAIVAVWLYTEGKMEARGFGIMTRR